MFSGKAIQLLSENQDTFHLDVEALESVLGNKKIRDKHVMLISISGEMRGGKSFMLNFFLRFLHSENKEHWLKIDEEPLIGFNWKNGDDKDTTGILLWSEPFIVKTQGEEYAVLLMDTQGTFDKKSSVKKNAMIFALSAMVSSVQIFNVRRQILEDKLQFLRLFTCYGRLAMAQCTETYKPFQHLHFLVRDWPCPYKNPYGLEGGDSYLEKVLHFDDSTHSEVKEVREFIKQCFSRIDCCLLPNPGMKVMNCETFAGHITDIESTFVEVLSSYVPKILSPEYMLPKAINGTRVTCSELLEYFKAYFNVFDSDEMPQPIDIFKATTAASNMATINTCKRLYVDEMDKLCAQQSKYLFENRLKKEHNRIKQIALSKFDVVKKFGDQPQIESYRNQLETEIEETFVGFVERNGKKKMYEKEVWSVLVLLMWYAMTKVLKYGFVCLGLETVSAVLDWTLFVLVVLLVVWIGSYFSGFDNEVKMYMDEVLLDSWQRLLRPLLVRLKRCVVRCITSGMAPVT